MCESGAGAWRQELKRSSQRSAIYWLASGLLSFLSCDKVQKYLLKEGTAHRGLGTSASINNKDPPHTHTHIDAPIGQSDLGNSLVEAPSSQVILICVTLTRTNTWILRKQYRKYWTCSPGLGLGFRFRDVAGSDVKDRTVPENRGDIHRETHHGK